MKVACIVIQNEIGAVAAVTLFPLIVAGDFIIEEGFESHLFLVAIDFLGDGLAVRLLVTLLAP